MLPGAPIPNVPLKYPETKTLPLPTATLYPSAGVDMLPFVFPNCRMPVVLKVVFAAPVAASSAIKNAVPKVGSKAVPVPPIVAFLIGKDPFVRPTVPHRYTIPFATAMLSAWSKPVPPKV